MSAATLNPPSGSPELASRHRLSHLRALEAESIHILREVAAQFEKPVMLYSIGKDSSVMLHLAPSLWYPSSNRRPLSLG